MIRRQSTKPVAASWCGGWWETSTHGSLNAKISVPEDGLSDFGFSGPQMSEPARDADDHVEDQRIPPCSADTSSNSWACWL